MGVSQVEGGQLVRGGKAKEVRRQVENLLRYDIDELTIIPVWKSKESVLEMLAEAVIGTL